MTVSKLGTKASTVNYLVSLQDSTSTLSIWTYTANLGSGTNWWSIAGFTTVTLQGSEWISYQMEEGQEITHSSVNKISLQFRASLLLHPSVNQGPSSLNFSYLSTSRPAQGKGCCSMPESTTHNTIIWPSLCTMPASTSQLFSSMLTPTMSFLLLLALNWMITGEWTSTLGLMNAVKVACECTVPAEFRRPSHVIAIFGFSLCYRDSKRLLWVLLYPSRNNRNPFCCCRPKSSIQQIVFHYGPQIHCKDGRPLARSPEKANLNEIHIHRQILISLQISMI